MGINIRYNSKALAPNAKAPFEGIGGLAPYLYSVVAGGAGGTINPSTGLYTAPSQTGIDTIRVTDAASQVAQLQVGVSSPIQLVCDIIQTYMQLQVGQVMLWDQKWNVPNDSRLYVVISELSCKPFANNNRLDGSGSSLNTILSTNFQVTLQLNVMSRTDIARLRKEEVILALMSDYSERQQEINSFYIAPISSSFINLSEVDGAAIPYQYSINVNMQYFVSKTQAVNYYDSFDEASVIVDP